MKNKIVISILSLSTLGLSHANEQTREIKSSAIVQSTCTISTNDINFGVVATPLMMQSAQSDMTVKCSNASPYTVELSYGGLYGSGTYSEYSVAYYGQNAVQNIYKVYSNNGVEEGWLQCGYGGSDRGQVYFGTAVIANLYGYTNRGWYTDNKGACKTNGTQSGTYPKGWVGSWNASGSQPIGSSTGYSYGVMSGMSNGDKLAYSIAVPGDANKVWNSGVNSYKSTGNGEFQTIPMIAKIVPDKSGSKYPAPDMYLDTITAVISY